MTDKKEIKDRLKILRNLCNLSQTKFVNIASIKIDTYKSWEIGKRIPSANALQKCIEVFRSYGIDTSIEWLLTGSGTNPTYKVKLDDNNQDTKNKIQVSNPVEELIFLQGHYKNFESFILNDNSMMPYFEPGDIVGGEKIEKFEIQNLFNQNCIFQLGSVKFSSVAI
jgi:transcriptional regulator with XRE-family HTH domain